MQFTKKLAVALLAGTLAAGPALAADPTGTWQTTTGESRYKVSYCGDGTQLCAKLTWLRDDARTAENLPYLNKLVVNRASVKAEDEWIGTVTYNGESFSGSLKLVGDDGLKLSGCKGIFCQSMRFKRV